MLTISVCAKHNLGQPYGICVFRPNYIHRGYMKLRFEWQWAQTDWCHNDLQLNHHQKKKIKRRGLNRLMRKATVWAMANSAKAVNGDTEPDGDDGWRHRWLSGWHASLRSYQCGNSGGVHWSVSRRHQHRLQNSRRQRVIVRSMQPRSGEEHWFTSIESYSSHTYTAEVN